VRPKLKPTAVVALCLDHRIVHETKVGVEQLQQYTFEGEIIYHFELGGVSRSWWTNKHNTILLFSCGNPTFHLDAVPLTERKAGRGNYTTNHRRVNSVWSITLSPTDPQRTGYPNQKPLKLIEPFIAVHTDEGDLVFDPFAGSGTTGLAAKNAGRRYVLSDINPEAIGVMARRGLS
jgi:site-specific DNA-methyltransferase (adenine-specific)